MKIYIPEHLRNLPIVDQMYKLIVGYENYYEENPDSFDDYYYNLKNDPVKRFLYLTIPEDSLNLGDSQNYEDIINYISRLFYSVKGTVKVFDYMKKYLNLQFDGEIEYTVRYIKFKLTSISVQNENLFYESLKDFLNALLYFQEMGINLDNVDLVIKGNISNSVGSNIEYFKEFSADIYKD